MHPIVGVIHIMPEVPALEWPMSVGYSTSFESLITFKICSLDSLGRRDIRTYFEIREGTAFIMFIWKAIRAAR